MHKYICTNDECTVYVYGDGYLKVCPNCKQPGSQLVTSSAIDFVDWYQHAVSLPTRIRV